jgi:hypothetical protein
VQKSKEELEREINETPYFTLTGEENSAARETEKNKLALTILDYCRKYWYEQTSDKWEEYNDTYNIESEVDMAIIGCLKSGVFDPNSGIPFLHYLKRSIKHAINRAVSYIEKKKTQEKDYIIKESNELKSLLESKDDDDLPRSTPGNICDLLGAINNVFKEKQERVKPYLRKLFTLELLKIRTSIENLPRGYECIDYDFFDKYSNELEIPSQKTVAADFGKDESDASRTIHTFYEKLKLIPEIGKMPRGHVFESEK